tara:strand:+ start:591 stop:704 length:114 start_codon:yes stop_codon:yes gene_type:complete
MNPNEKDKWIVIAINVVACILVAAFIVYVFEVLFNIF